MVLRYLANSKVQEIGRLESNKYVARVLKFKKDSSVPSKCLLRSADPLLGGSLEGWHPDIVCPTQLLLSDAKYVPYALKSL